jgi:hypothetical protein
VVQAGPEAAIIRIPPPFTYTDDTGAAILHFCEKKIPQLKNVQYGMDGSGEKEKGVT